MTNSEEWEEIVESFQPKTEEQKLKEANAEARRIQIKLPLPDLKVRKSVKIKQYDKDTDN